MPFQALHVNSRQLVPCKCNGWLYIDNCDLFYSKNILYARNGVRLSLQGVEVPVDSLERSLNTPQEFFRVVEGGGANIRGIALQVGTRELRNN